MRKRILFLFLMLPSLFLANEISDSLNSEKNISIIDSNSTQNFILVNDSLFTPKNSLVSQKLEKGKDSTEVSTIRNFFSKIAKIYKTPKEKIDTSLVSYSQFVYKFSEMNGEKANFTEISFYTKVQENFHIGVSFSNLLDDVYFKDQRNLDSLGVKDGKIKVDLFYGGLCAKYTYNFNKYINVATESVMSVGKAKITHLLKDSTADFEVEEKFIYVLEPRLELTLKPLKNFHIGGFSSYRIMDGQDSDYIFYKDLKAIAYGVFFRWGI